MHALTQSIATAAAVAALLVAPAAFACSIVGNESVTPDPAEVGVDIAAPAALGPVTVNLNRGTRPEADGCGGGAATSCDDIAILDISFDDAIDDRTPAERMGYVVRLVAGSLPTGITLSDEPVRLPGGGLVYSFGDNSEDQDDIDFTVSITPVDLAGNEGPGTEVRIRAAGNSACSGGSTSALTLLLWFGAAMLTIGHQARRIARV